jgi:hypothetical protein
MHQYKSQKTSASISSFLQQKLPNRRTSHCNPSENSLFGGLYPEFSSANATKIASKPEGRRREAKAISL